MADNISTHILDTASGRPAANIKASLHRCVNPSDNPDECEFAWTYLLDVVTDANGRARFDKANEIGIFKVVFYTQSYFQAHGTAHFYPKVEIMFRIADVDTHYHVPLILSPFGYSTYRGS